MRKDRRSSPLHYSIFHSLQMSNIFKRLSSSARSDDSPGEDSPSSKESIVADEVKVDASSPNPPMLNETKMAANEDNDDASSQRKDGAVETRKVKFNDDASSQAKDEEGKIRKKKRNKNCCFCLGDEIKELDQKLKAEVARSECLQELLRKKTEELDLLNEAYDALCVKRYRLQLREGEIENKLEIKELEMANKEAAFEGDKYELRTKIRSLERKLRVLTGAPLFEEKKRKPSPDKEGKDSKHPAKKDEGGDGDEGKDSATPKTWKGETGHDGDHAIELE